MFLKLKAGSTSRAIPVKIKDTSSTTGGGLSGLVYNTASLAAAYRREGQNSWTTITLVNATLGTWTSGGFIANGSRAGSYELGLPDAALASGAKFVEIVIYGATNMLDCNILIELDVIDYQTTIPTQVDSALVNYDSGNGVAYQSSVLDITLNIGTILNRIGAFTGTGVNTLLGFLRSMMRKDGGITTPSDVGGNYTHTTDSFEAIRDQGDAAWTGGGGGGDIYGEAGSIVFTYTVYDTNGTTPLEGVSVFVSSDISGVNRSQAKLTDSLGQVQFALNPGTVYFWRERFDRTFTDPDTETVS